MSGPTVDVAIVGLGFGAAFVPIYRDHPAVGEVAIVDPSEALRGEVGDRFGLTHRFGALEDVLADPRWQAVHVLTPVRFHAEHTLAVLAAGRHCACAVPMATDLDEIAAIVAATRAAGTVYTMVETALATREYRTAERLVRGGELGELSLYRGFHLQDLDGFADYWQGFPPMHYATHALAPALGLTGTRVARVRALGSGRLDERRRRGGFDNPFPTEVGLFELDGPDVVADVTVSFSQLARTYREGFDVYGRDLGLEWPDPEDGPWRGHRLLPERPGRRGRPTETVEIATDDEVERLPAPLRRYARPHLITPADGAEPFTAPAEHGGSHPHLVDRFVSAIVDGAPPLLDVVGAGDLTAAGIVAHRSALAGGEPMEVPHHG